MDLDPDPDPDLDPTPIRLLYSIQQVTCKIFKNADPPQPCQLKVTSVLDTLSDWDMANVVFPTMLIKLAGLPI
jgi:hypothetical protein